MQNRKVNYPEKGKEKLDTKIQAISVNPYTYTALMQQSFTLILNCLQVVHVWTEFNKKTYPKPKRSLISVLGIYFSNIHVLFPLLKNQKDMDHFRNLSRQQNQIKEDENNNKKEGSTWYFVSI